MKTIERTMWANINDLVHNNHNVNLSPTDPKTDEHVKVTVISEVPSYQIKIVKGLNGYHLVNDSSENRMPFKDFMDLLNKLKTGGSCKVAWDIYPGQPVWEFNWSEGTLAHKIKEYCPMVEVL